MEETEQWTYVSGNEESLQSWEERHLTQAVGLQEETSSRMIIWSFVLPNITLTVPDQSVFALSCMTFYQSLLCVFLPFKNPSASKGYLYSQVALFGKPTFLLLIRIICDCRIRITLVITFSSFRSLMTHSDSGTSCLFYWQKKNQEKNKNKKKQPLPPF